MNAQQIRVIVALTAAGGGALLWAWVIDSETFAPAVLIEIGAAFLLFGGLYFLETQYLGRRVENIEKKAAQLATDVDDVRTEIRDAKSELAEVGEQARRLIERRRTGDTAALDRLDEEISLRSIIDVLKRARDLDATSEGGVRVKVGANWSRLVFRVEDNELEVVLQGVNGERLEKWIWEDRLSPPQLMAQVAEGLVRAHDFSESEFDASAVFAKLRETLNIAFSCRWGQRPPAGGLDPVIEIPNDQWAVTECGLECLEQAYVIDANRLDEPDWRSHMREKMWVDQDKFEEGLRILEGLARSDSNLYFPFLPRP